jgi:glycerol-3-phosphate dehydrogenase (NAD(P)+)
LKVTVLGCGNWGSSFAILLHHKGQRVTVWEYDRTRAEKVRLSRDNTPFLVGLKIPDAIKITDDLARSVRECEICVFALPSGTLRAALAQLKPVVPRRAVYLSLIKGIEPQTLLRMSQVIAEGLDRPDPVVVLSGPCIANEVVRGQPTSVVVASQDEAAAGVIQRSFATDSFRIYRSHDVTGVELGGALKNVMAIACGICDGLALGDNIRGALITRGLAEITRLGVKMGAQAETFAGLSGVGDLVTTATSPHSRNHYLGEQIGRGRKLSEILKEMPMVAEGVSTTPAACAMAEKYDTEMPISREVYQILFKGKTPALGLKHLMTRPLKKEAM